MQFHKIDFVFLRGIYNYVPAGTIDVIVFMTCDLFVCKTCNLLIVQRKHCNGNIVTQLQSSKS